MSLSFARLNIDHWQQFREIDIEFDSHLTVITGANGAGKTTILNLLGRHAGWTVPALATPTFSKLSTAMQYVINFFGLGSPPSNQIGAIKYSTGSTCSLAVPSSLAPTYNLELHNQQEVPCFVVPSHRSVYRYQQLAAIPAARQDKNQAFNRVWGSTRNRYAGAGEVPSSYHMKEILVAWSIFGRGNEDMPADVELAHFYEQFAETLRRLLPRQIGFRRFSIRNLEVVLECDSGEFMIDGASGGLSTVIDLAWQLFMYQTAEHKNFTVLIDEVENHLHPTMQRRILPDLVEAFPAVQFIVSTHSPLVVSSHRGAAVYVLRNDREGVVSQRLDFETRAATANEVLNEALGVDTTYPIWAEERLRAALARFSKNEVSAKSIQSLRSELTESGLAHLIPDALMRAADDDKNR